ncbi:DUF2225 domain-containing protein [Clostridium estertheticum]|uniref:DUF2225 domain-containing protein n=1 Tax=Clostridium estertheticum TaxID=238834 RepID=UPI00124F1F3C|nr:DUF2225 domain-containing protein [Clostridium estertheticum]MBU3073806.1 DUF2225 domain-containing protein [Clostridium estertheticum]MBU3163899.1 DUF2225 domain-containing protein [Clostridium estertheticum]MBU3172282.1 DUF2225 domain-containing protein [Clostridium estertheticum]MBU3184122.1 DUF2225 domain-containing protein [Clostridium estertheticum]MBZ9615974.1 DUF2225 domain-containing protein [Clostridium estertheticum subsp. laramiense]
MDKNIFSGLENMGFDNIDHINIYNKETEAVKESKEKSFLYNKEVTCPVCNHVFKAATVKSSAYRMIKKDSDFFIRYSLINPYFYDVWLCNSCGYAAMKTDFYTIRSIEIEQVQKSISSKWHGRMYPEVYDVHVAIERYKLSLLNYVITNAKSSKKAINCMKLAWMYRLIDTQASKEIELVFLKQALEGLSDAYYAEAFPIYGMDKYSAMYLIGELNRRLGHTDDSLVWFSNVITTPNVKQNLKELARDMKDLIKEEAAALLADTDNSNISSTENFEPLENTKKSSFFSKLFK